MLIFDGKETKMWGEVKLTLGPLEAKAKALEEAMDFEYDSKLVANAVLGVSSPQETISKIITGLCQKLQAFRIMRITHGKWTKNRLAHILDQYAKALIIM